MGTWLSSHRGGGQNGDGACEHLREALEAFETASDRDRKIWYGRSWSDVKMACASRRCGCTDARELWVCLGCGELHCHSPLGARRDSRGASHAMAHAASSATTRHGVCEHVVLLHARESLVCCTACKTYLYPREMAGHDDNEEALDDVVADWLQVLGRHRRWWSLHGNEDEDEDEDEEEGGGGGAAAGKKKKKTKKKKTKKESSALVRKGAGKRGLRNLGNTCFFNSPLQALLHAPMLRQELAAFKFVGEEEPPVQRELRLLGDAYWGAPVALASSSSSSSSNSTKRKKARGVISPRPLFKALASTHWRGYDKDQMEDANGLVLAILADSMAEPLVHRTFGVPVCKTVRCMDCEPRRVRAAALLRRLFGARRLGPASNTSVIAYRHPSLATYGLAGGGGGSDGGVVGGGGSKRVRRDDTCPKLGKRRGTEAEAGADAAAVTSTRSQEGWEGYGVDDEAGLMRPIHDAALLIVDFLIGPGQGRATAEMNPVLSLPLTTEREIKACADELQGRIRRTFARGARPRRTRHGDRVETLQRLDLLLSLPSFAQDHHLRGGDGPGAGPGASAASAGASGDAVPTLELPMLLRRFVAQDKPDYKCESCGSRHSCISSTRLGGFAPAASDASPLPQPRYEDEIGVCRVVPPRPEAAGHDVTLPPVVIMNLHRFCSMGLCRHCMKLLPHAEIRAHERDCEARAAAEAGEAVGVEAKTRQQRAPYVPPITMAARSEIRLPLRISLRDLEMVPAAQKRKHGDTTIDKLNYDLFATVVQDGGLGGGHYVAFVRTDLPTTSSPPSSSGAGASNSSSSAQHAGGGAAMEASSTWLRFSDEYVDVATEEMATVGDNIFHAFFRRV